MCLFLYCLLITVSCMSLGTPSSWTSSSEARPLPHGTQFYFIKRSTYHSLSSICLQKWCRNPPSSSYAVIASCASCRHCIQFHYNLFLWNLSYFILTTTPHHYRTRPPPPTSSCRSRHPGCSKLWTCIWTGASPFWILPPRWKPSYKSGRKSPMWLKSYRGLEIIFKQEFQCHRI